MRFRRPHYIGLLPSPTSFFERKNSEEAVLDGGWGKDEGQSAEEGDEWVGGWLAMWLGGKGREEGKRKKEMDGWVGGRMTSYVVRRWYCE